MSEREREREREDAAMVETPCVKRSEIDNGPIHTPSLVLLIQWKNQPKSTLLFLLQMMTLWSSQK